MVILNYTIEDLNTYANQVKDIVLQDLYNNKIITENQFKELSKTKIISNVKYSCISNFFKRLVKKYKEIDEINIVIGTANYLKDEFEERPLKKEDVKEALKAIKE